MKSRDHTQPLGFQDYAVERVEITLNLGDPRLCSRESRVHTQPLGFQENAGERVAITLNLGGS